MLPFSATSGLIINFNHLNKNNDKKIDCGFVVNHSDDHCIFMKLFNVNENVPKSDEDNGAFGNYLMDLRYQSTSYLPISIRKDRFQDRNAYTKMFSYKGIVDKVHYPSIQRILQNVNNWDFNIFALERFTAGFPLTYLSIELFEKHNLINEFQLNKCILHKFFMSIEKSYHQANPYHNALHAADVTQAINCIIQDPVIFKDMTRQDVLCALLSTICHDVDHPGFNNTYLNNSKHFLSVLYQQESVLENHHWAFSLSVLKEMGLFSHFSSQQWKTVSTTCASLIRATDISKQNFYISNFNDKLITKSTYEIPSNCTPTEEEKVIILQMAIKCADICNPCRRWDVCNCWAYLVTEEFFQQGDKEKSNSLPISPIMDREKCKLAVIQRDFIRFLVLPLFTAWSNYAKSELSSRFMATINHNSSLWQQLAELPPTESDSIVLASIQSVYDRIQLMQVMDYTQGHQLSHLQQVHMALLSSGNNMVHEYDQCNMEDDEDRIIAAATASYVASNRSSCIIVDANNNTDMDLSDDENINIDEEGDDKFIVQQQQKQQKRRYSRDLLFDEYSQRNAGVGPPPPPVAASANYYTRRGSLPITLQSYTMNQSARENTALMLKKKQQQKMMTRRTSLQTGPGYTTLLTGLHNSTTTPAHTTAAATCATTTTGSSNSSVVGPLTDTTNTQFGLLELSQTLIQTNAHKQCSTTPIFPTNYRRGSAPAIRASIFPTNTTNTTNPTTVNMSSNNRRRASLTGGCIGCGVTSTHASILSAHMKQHANSLQDVQIP